MVNIFPMRSRLPEWFSTMSSLLTTQQLFLRVIISQWHCFLYSFNYRDIFSINKLHTVPASLRAQTVVVWSCDTFYQHHSIVVVVLIVRCHNFTKQKYLLLDYVFACSSVWCLSAPAQPENLLAIFFLIYLLVPVKFKLVFSKSFVVFHRWPCVIANK